MGPLVTMDPGAKSLAWAAFDGEVLARAGFERGDDPAALWAAIHARFGFAWDDCDVVIELPQIYKQRAWKGDPNDLVAVAVTAGAAAYACRGARVRFVRPHDWKGSVTKSVMTARIESKLSADELKAVESAAPKSLRHNVLDAVGIGLKERGRLK